MTDLPEPDRSIPAREGDGPPQEPFPVRDYKDGPAQDQMTVKSPMALLIVMVLAGVLGIAGFVMGVAKFLDTGDGGALAFGLFALILFGLLSAGGIFVALTRLKWKRRKEAYHRGHPEKPQ